MKIHGYRHRPEYTAWISMRDRCKNPRNISYKYYAPRGIKVCEAWDNSFNAFINDVGDRPSPQHSLDRMDNSKGYEPGNVRWATSKEQAQNTRRIRYILVNDKKISFRDACNLFQITIACFYYRLSVGWSVLDALTTPQKG